MSPTQSARESVDLIIGARWLVPVAPIAQVLPAHGVAVRDGRIVALGPVGELLARFEPAEQLQRPRHVLLPGLVDAWCLGERHLLRAAPALSLERLAQRAGVALARPCARDGLRLACAGMLRAGITAFGMRASFPEEAVQVASDARLRALIGLPVGQGADGGGPGLDGQLEHAAALWDQQRDDGRIALAFSPDAATVDPALERVRRICDELDARLYIELRAGGRSAGQLAQLRLLHPNCTLADPGARAAAAAALVARHGASLVLQPQRALAGGAAAALAALLHDAALSARIALGSGDAASRHAGLDAELHLAGLLAGDAQGLGHDQEAALRALGWATLGGAAALGMTSRIGSLEPGKAADLIAVEAPAAGAADARALPQHLIGRADRMRVSDVWIGGRTLLANGRLLGLDEEELAALEREWDARLESPARPGHTGRGGQA